MFEGRLKWQGQKCNYFSQVHGRDLTFSRNLRNNLFGVPFFMLD